MERPWAGVALLALLIAGCATTPAGDAGAPAGAQAAARGDADASFDPGILGVWRSQDGATALAITPTHVGWAEGERLVYRSAIIGGDGAHLSLLSRGRPERLSYRLEGERLVLGTSAGGTISLAPAPALAAVFDPRPLPLPSAAPVPAEAVEALNDALQARVDADQAARSEPVATTDAERRMQALDAENTAWLRDQVAEVGWIDARRFGSIGAMNAFILTQHSGDLPLMMAALPQLEADCRAQLIPCDPYAALYDRLQIILGVPQRYGSQLMDGPGGELVVAPMEAPEEVDERRAALGLETLAEYLSRFSP